MESFFQRSLPFLTHRQPGGRASAVTTNPVRPAQSVRPAPWVCPAEKAAGLPVTRGWGTIRNGSGGRRRTAVCCSPLHKKSNGYPIGGSREFARAIEGRYIGLGGKIRYKTKVDTIIVEADRAVGVACGGEEHRADEVISCADGHATIFDMLGGKHVNPDRKSVV